MAPKEILVSDDAYEVLLKLRIGREGFSDTILRLAKKGTISDCAGLWADMFEKDFNAIREAVNRSRKEID
jgi:predicted CopG family antitoxin